MAPPRTRLHIQRPGVTSAMVPKPVICVDTREQQPYDFRRFGNWIEGVERATLDTGDYAIAGMEDVARIERKTLKDVVMSLTAERKRFLREMERMEAYPHRMLLIEASFSDIKTPYTFHSEARAHPNGIAGSLMAIAARHRVQVCFGCTRKLAEELAASYLSKLHAYEWLERAGLSRQLVDGDL